MSIKWDIVLTVTITLILFKLLVEPLMNKVLPNGLISNFEEYEEISE